MFTYHKYIDLRIDLVSAGQLNELEGRNGEV